MIKNLTEKFGMIKNNSHKIDRSNMNCEWKRWLQPENCVLNSTTIDELMDSIVDVVEVI